MDRPVFVQTRVLRERLATAQDVTAERLLSQMYSSMILEIRLRRERLLTFVTTVGSLFGVRPHVNLSNVGCGERGTANVAKEWLLARVDTRMFL